MLISSLCTAFAIVASIFAWLAWRAKSSQLKSVSASKEAEIAAKDTLINSLQESLRTLPELRSSAQQVPVLEEQLRTLRLERDSHLVMVADHKKLLIKSSEAEIREAGLVQQIAGLRELILSKDETVREANDRAAASSGERDQLRSEFDSIKLENGTLRKRLTEITAELEATKTQLDSEKKLFDEKAKILADSETALRDAFGSLSSNALKSNNAAFLDLAQQSFAKLAGDAKQDLEAREKSISALIDPVKNSLHQFDQQLRELESSRVSAYSTLTTQVRGLAETQDFLRKETGNLVKALRAPQVRGRWGELTLRRVVEMAGMLDHCDFIEQESTTTESGSQRPDMIVRMPGNRRIIVDAKVPLNAYLDALEIQDEEARRLKLSDHARQLRDHVTKLSRKSYWEQYRNETPEFVVLFIPGEVFYSAALEFDPSLLEQATNDKVMLAVNANLNLTPFS